MGILELLADRFTFGFYFDDDGTTRTDGDPEMRETPFFPVGHEGTAPIYAPLRQRAIDHGHHTVVCPRCTEPVWHMTRHAVERHGDADVTVIGPLEGKTPPDWFRSEWI